MVSTPRVPQIGFTRRSGRCGEVLRLFRNISITVMAIAGNRPPRPTIVQHFDLRGSLLFDLPQRAASRHAGRRLRRRHHRAGRGPAGSCTCVCVRRIARSVAAWHPSVSVPCPGRRSASRPSRRRTGHAALRRGGLGLAADASITARGDDLALVLATFRCESCGAGSVRGPGRPHQRRQARYALQSHDGRLRGRSPGL